MRTAADAIMAGRRRAGVKPAIRGCVFIAIGIIDLLAWAGIAYAVHAGYVRLFH